MTDAKKTSIYEAMLKAQGEFEKVTRTDTAFNYKYAPLDQVIEKTRKGLSDNGLVIMQFPVNEEDRVGVKTILAHTSGETIESQYTTSSYKKDPQGVGSLITYFRRYAYMAVCGIAQEDDDAQSAMPTDKIDVQTRVKPVVDSGTISFGKHAGSKWEDIPTHYLKWLVENSNDAVARTKAQEQIEKRSVANLEVTEPEPVMEDDFGIIH